MVRMASYSLVLCLFEIRLLALFCQKIVPEVNLTLNSAQGHIRDTLRPFWGSAENPSPNLT